MKKDSPDKALNEEVEEANDLEATPASEEEASEDVSETEPAGEVEEEETGESVQKKGYSQRVQELNKRAKQAEAKAQSLEERIATLTAPVEPRYPEYQQQSQEEPIVAPGEEIDAAELDKRLRAREQRILQRANASSDLRAKQTEAIVRINNETGEVLRKYPELDPESKDFNRDLSDSITESVEALVRAEPYSASVTKFVDKLMKPYKGAVSKEVGKATENLAKQVSEAAVRPSSVSKGEKPFEELSVEEMEKRLGVVQT